MLSEYLSRIISGQRGRSFIFYCNSTQIRLHHLSPPKESALFSIHLFCPFVVCFHRVNTHFDDNSGKKRTKYLPSLYLCLLFKSLKASQLCRWKKSNIWGKKKNILVLKLHDKEEISGKKGVERCELPYLIPHKYKNKTEYFSVHGNFFITMFKPTDFFCEVYSFLQSWRAVTSLRLDLFDQRSEGWNTHGFLLTFFSFPVIHHCFFLEFCMMTFMFFGQSNV